MLPFTGLFGFPMSSVCTRRGEFSKLMPNHVLCNIDGNKSFPVINGKSMRDKIRQNRRSTRPGFEYFFFPSHIHILNFLQQLLVYKWSFFYRSWHNIAELQVPEPEFLQRSELFIRPPERLALIPSSHNILI